MPRSKQSEYPTWVCHPCGTRYGKWYQGDTYTGPKHLCSTMHVGRCDLCGSKEIAVTEPRDYGHLVITTLQTTQT